MIIQFTQHIQLSNPRSPSLIQTACKNKSQIWILYVDHPDDQGILKISHQRFSNSDRTWNQIPPLDFLFLILRKIGSPDYIDLGSFMEQTEWVSYTQKKNQQGCMISSTKLERTQQNYTWIIQRNIRLEIQMFKNAGCPKSITTTRFDWFWSRCCESLTIPACDLEAWKQVFLKVFQPSLSIFKLSGPILLLPRIS